MARRSRIDRDSVEYLTVPVTAPADVVLGSQVAQIALVPEGQRPVTEDWRAASWAGSSLRVLVGPFTTPGTHSVFVKIGASPETPLLLAGQIYVA